MKIEKIFFEQLFPTGNFSNQRLGIEISIQEGDFVSDERVKEIYASAKVLVNDAFQKLNPSLPITSTDYHTGESSMPLNSSHIDALGFKTPSVHGIIKDIMECDVIDLKNAFGVQTGLLGYEHLTSKDEKIKEAYDKRLKQLSDAV
jgi:hypothetical protein